MNLASENEKREKKGSHGGHGGLGGQWGRNVLALRRLSGCQDGRGLDAESNRRGVRIAPTIQKTAEDDDDHEKEFGHDAKQTRA